MLVAELGNDKGPVCLYLLIFILCDRKLKTRTEHLRLEGGEMAEAKTRTVVFLRIKDTV